MQVQFLSSAPHENESLRYTKESEVFYLHLGERFKRAARFFSRCLEKTFPIEKEQLVVACLSEAVLLIRQMTDMF